MLNSKMVRLAMNAIRTLSTDAVQAARLAIRARRYADEQRVSTMRTLNADVEFHAVMSPKELKKAGLDVLGKKWA